VFTLNTSYRWCPLCQSVYTDAGLDEDLTQLNVLWLLSLQNAVENPAPSELLSIYNLSAHPDDPQRQAYGHVIGYVESVRDFLEQHPLTSRSYPGGRNIKHMPAWVLPFRRYPGVIEGYCVDYGSGWVLVIFDRFKKLLDRYEVIHNHYFVLLSLNLTSGRINRLAGFRNNLKVVTDRYLLSQYAFSSAVPITSVVAPETFPEALRQRERKYRRARGTSPGCTRSKRRRSSSH
jgi:hypothetical protein